MSPNTSSPLGGLLEGGTSSTNDLTTRYSINKRNTDVIMTSLDESITLTLKGVNSLTLNLNTIAPEYQTDAGFKINDHLALEPPYLDLSAVLTDEWSTSNDTNEGRDTLLSKLRGLRDKREVFNLVCDFGNFPGMVFDSFSVEENNDSINSFTLNFTVKKTIRATLLVSQINFIYDEDSDQLLGLDVQTGQTVEISLYAFSALNEEDKSMLDQLWQSTPWGD